MDVYKIVVTVIALVIVTLLSVIAEMLGKAQEKRRDSPTDHRKMRPAESNEKQPDETITSPVSPMRIDTQQNRESSPPEIHKHKGATSEQDR